MQTDIALWTIGVDYTKNSKKNDKQTRELLYLCLYMRSIMFLFSFLFFLWLVNSSRDSRLCNKTPGTTQIYCCSTRYTTHETDSLRTQQKNFGNFSFFLLSRARANSVIAIPAQTKVLCESQYTFVYIPCRMGSRTKKAEWEWSSCRVRAVRFVFVWCAHIMLCACILSYRTQWQLRRNQGLPIAAQKDAFSIPSIIEIGLWNTHAASQIFLFPQIENVVYVISMD